MSVRFTDIMSCLPVNIDRKPPTQTGERGRKSVSAREGIGEPRGEPPKRNPHLTHIIPSIFRMTSFPRAGWRSPK